MTNRVTRFDQKIVRIALGHIKSVTCLVQLLASAMPPVGISRSSLGLITLGLGDEYKLIIKVGSIGRDTTHILQEYNF